MSEVTYPHVRRVFYRELDGTAKNFVLHQETGRHKWHISQGKNAIGQALTPPRASLEKEINPVFVRGVDNFHLKNENTGVTYLEIDPGDTSSIAFSTLQTCVFEVIDGVRTLACEAER